MSNRRYTITITEHTTEKRIKGRSWEKGAGDTPEEYGYTPEVETTVTVERKLYEQNTDELDVVAVIQAVNGIDETVRIECADARLLRS